MSKKHQPEAVQMLHKSPCDRKSSDIKMESNSHMIRGSQVLQALSLLPGLKMIEIPMYIRVTNPLALQGTHLPKVL